MSTEDTRNECKATQRQNEETESAVGKERKGIQKRSMALEDDAMKRRRSSISLSRGEEEDGAYGRGRLWREDRWGYVNTRLMKGWGQQLERVARVGWGGKLAVNVERVVEQ
eukprot:757289-Hanusia_phi.AAC.3